MAKRLRRGMKAPGKKGRYVAPAGSKARGVKTFSKRQMKAYFATGGFARAPRKKRGK